MENKQGIVRLTRKQIYDNVWELSVAGMARKYNLNYAKLIEACRRETVPFPPSGYWTRRNCGKDVSQENILLEGDEDAVVELVTKDFKVSKIKKKEEIINRKFQTEEVRNEDILEKKKKSQIDGLLTFIEEPERTEIIRKAWSLEIEDNVRLHKLLVQYKKQMKEYTSKINVTRNSGYNRPANEPNFFNEVSEAGIQRLMTVLDAVFKAVESLGGTVNDDLSMEIRGEFVRIRVAEAKDKVEHEITKQETQALLKYEEEKRKYRWASKPQIRQYDHIYNGRLRIVFGERKYIRDSESEKLEDRLGDILIALYEKAEENRIVREIREEENRKREEEKRRQEEQKKRKENEIIRTKELVNKAEDYRIASEIRAYISAMVVNGHKEATPDWIEWASKKADWYDPTLEIEDDCLGKREHGKSREEKDFDKANYRRNWLW